MNATITLDAAHPQAKVHKEIYGHFSEHLGRCIYGGLFVGKDSPISNDGGVRLDVVEALKNLEVPVLRWPGGCFADEYHWRDGVGDPAKRARMVNTNWGGVVEDHSFGTHEFMHLCRLLGAQPYVNGNVGSGTVREMAEWVEYLNSEGDSTTARERWHNGSKEPFHVRYWGVGNESWGCGGNMRPEYYADEFRRYQTYCRDYSDDRLYRIACGPNTDDYHWTEVLMQQAGKYMDALTLHYYTVPGKEWSHKGSATVFDTETYYTTLRKAARMDELIRGHLAIMDRYDPEHRVGLIVDEWGCWHDVEPGTNPGFLYQQNTMRDAMVAALTLDIFNRHADRVVMANLAQMVNVLQAVILTDGEKLLLTPTYHVFDLYRPHMDALSLNCSIVTDEAALGVAGITASSSCKDGVITVTCSNLSATENAQLLVRLDGAASKTCSGRILTGEMSAYNDFDAPTRLTPTELCGIRSTEQGYAFTLPACSVAALSFHG
ncbi:MAG: alpha-L-arabinofuranosidase C-terminal domain-containing protein [Eubacteriales bacterium]|nr:alpha-L-arabinofuranosidase C-terminal domain-containing protein [Eubacteriales bacterium]